MVHFRIKVIGAADFLSEQQENLNELKTNYLKLEDQRARIE